MHRLALTLVSLLLLTPSAFAQQVIPVSTYSIAELQSSVSAASLPQAWKQDLISTLQNAQVTYARGDTGSVGPILEGFAREIQAQTPTFVSSELAAPWLLTVDGILGALEAGLPLGGVQLGREGGLLRVADPGSAAFGVELNIPPNALLESTFVSISVSLERPPNRALSLVGPGIVLGPEGLALRAPATLVLPYPDDDQDGIVDGTEFPADALKVGAVESGDRIGFPRRVLDSENRLQGIAITRFARYWNVAWQWNGSEVLTYRFSWPSSGVSFARGDDLNLLREAVRRAVGVWEPVLQEAGIRFEEVPGNQPATFRLAFFARRTPLTGTGDGAVEVFAHQNPGVTGLFFDVLFNANFGAGSNLVWTTDTSGNPTAVSIESVAVHGLGHLLGLSDRPSVPGFDIPVMSTDVDLLFPEICLHPPDVAALRDLYGLSASAPFPSCPNAEVAVVPTEFDFGQVAVGSTAETSFNLENSGRGTLVISEVVAENDFEIDLSSTDLSLRPGQSSNFEITFAPTEGMGEHQGVVRIVSNAPDSPALINLRAATPLVAPACTLTAEPEEIARGDSTILSWTSRSFVAQAVLDGYTGSLDPAERSVSVSPAETRTYTLSVSNDAGTGTCSVEVAVVSLPTSEVIWNRQFGTDGDDGVQAIATYESDVFVAGEIGGAVGAFGQAFLTRLNSDGVEQWMLEIPSSRASGIGVDPSGVYVVGDTEGALAGSPASFGEWDGFLRKYDLDGNLIWTRQIGSAARDRAMAIAVDPAGSLYVVGVTEAVLPNQQSFGSWDAFIRKYDFEGNELWTRQFGTAGDDFSRDVSFYGSGVIVAGDVGGTLPGQTGGGGSDAFVRRYDESGTEIWADQFGTTGSEFVEGLAVGDSGIFVVGEMEDVFTAGAYDAFLRMYTLDGVALWTRPFGASGASDFAAGVALDDTGVYVGGETEGTFPGQTALGSVDAFVRKYDVDGDEIWTRQYGTPDPEDSFDIAVDRSGIYLGGTTFGAFSDETNAGSVDAFLLKISK